MEALEITSFELKSSLIAVQNRMLQDQNIDPTPTNRWLLECANMNSWDIYICLLYAEIECYRSDRKWISIPTLDQFMDDNKEILDMYKLVRDKLLHPLKNIDDDKTLSDFLDSSKNDYLKYFCCAEECNIFIDQYIHTIRNHLIEAHSDEVANLPETELFVLVSEESTDLLEAQESCHTEEERRGLEEPIRGNQELLQKLGIDLGEKHPRLTPRQRKKIDAIRETMRLLAIPSPTSKYEFDDEVQTPIHKRLLSAFLQSEESGGLRFFGAELPDYLQGARAGYFTLILRSMVCGNECLHFAESVLARCFPRLSREEILEIEDWENKITWYETSAEWEQLVVATSHSMIALGLLADPVRVYRDVTSKNNELKIYAVEDELDEEIYELYQKWRNVVFHVADARVRDPEEIEFRFLTQSILAHRYEKIVKGLQRFFLSKDANGKIKIDGQEAADIKHIPM